MKRRTALIGAVAALAAVAGVGGALWRSRSQLGPPTVDVWSLRFARPEGGELAMAGFRGQPLLLNFWATWCPPCVTELPLLDQFERDQRSRGWRVVGLAIDNPEPVREFLAKRPVGFAIGLAGSAGVELARALGNAGGALPFTVVFDRSGNPIRRKLGVIEPDDLRAWTDSAA